jgi:8-amino-7-oxononanoate synthase
MDGDIAPLPEMLQLADEHDALLLIDDAHGFGVLGPAGAAARRTSGCARRACS